MAGSSDTTTEVVPEQNSCGCKDNRDCSFGACEWGVCVCPTNVEGRACDKLVDDARCPANKAGPTCGVCKDDSACNSGDKCFTDGLTYTSTYTTCRALENPNLSISTMFEGIFPLTLETKRDKTKREITAHLWTPQKELFLGCHATQCYPFKTKGGSEDWKCLEVKCNKLKDSIFANSGSMTADGINKVIENVSKKMHSTDEPAFQMTFSKKSTKLTGALLQKLTMIFTGCSHGACAHSNAVPMSLLVENETNDWAMYATYAEVALFVALFVLLIIFSYVQRLRLLYKLREKNNLYASALNPTTCEHDPKTGKLLPHFIALPESRCPSICSEHDVQRNSMNRRAPASSALGALDIASLHPSLARSFSSQAEMNGNNINGAGGAEAGQYLPNEYSVAPNDTSPTSSEQQQFQQRQENTLGEVTGTSTAVSGNHRNAGDQGNSNIDAQNGNNEDAIGISNRTLNNACPIKSHMAPLYTFKNVTYSIGKKQILRGISGTLEPGTLNALIGPSGAGKSTLLDVLAHSSMRGRVSGEFYIDGQRLRKREKKFRRCVGFVNQEDFLVPWLTVYESLWFAANTRLPEVFTYKQKKQIVDNIIDELNLNSVRDGRIGGNGAPRGLSGGELRRLSIAIEIVTGPSFVFLDEPTSGLDSHNAAIVVQCLHRLAKVHGKTILCSIHQPRSDIFASFDSVLLVSSGVAMYSGKTENLAESLEARGFVRPRNLPDADFALDVALGYELVGVEEHKNSDMKGAKDTNIKLATIVENSEEQKVSEEADPGADVADLKRPSSVASDGNLPAVKNQKNENSVGNSNSETDLKADGSKAADDEIDDIEKNSMQASSEVSTFDASGIDYSVSTFQQTVCLLHRGAKCLVRDSQMLSGHLLFSVASTISICLLYPTVEITNNGMQNRLAFVSLTLMLMSLISLSVITNLNKDIKFFRHECSNGSYPPWLYVVVKIITDLVPLRLIPTLISAIICYYRIGFFAESLSYPFYFSVVISLFSVTTFYISFLLGLLIPDMGVASLILIITTLAGFAYSGANINVTTLTDSTFWLRYLSVFRYPLEAIMINELKGLPTKTDPELGNPVDGNFFMRFLGYNVGNYYFNIFFLILINFVLFFLCLVIAQRKISRIA